MKQICEAYATSIEPYFPRIGYGLLQMQDHLKIQQWKG